MSSLALKLDNWNGLRISARLDLTLTSGEIYWAA
jgi:hypothetical protein